MFSENLLLLLDSWSNFRLTFIFFATCIETTFVSLETEPALARRDHNGHKQSSERAFVNMNYY